jgi:hypothetical protein
LTDIFIQDEVDLSPRGASGVYKILQGCIATLDAVQAPIQELYSDPVAARFREAVPLMEHEYRRGLRAGAATLVRVIESQSPELARAVRPWVSEEALAACAPPAAPATPDGGPASYPRFADREPDTDTGADPGADATDHTGTDG